MNNGWLLDRMAQWRDLTAIIWRDQPYTYHDLLARTHDWVATLRDRGVGAGTVVALVTRQPQSERSRSSPSPVITRPLAENRLCI